MVKVTICGADIAEGIAEAVFKAMWSAKVQ